MDDRTANIDQLLCTHCTYGTSFLHRSTTHLKDQVFEDSARAGSVERAQSHELFRRIASLLNYRLPADAPHQALIENNARSLPKRLIYHPALNGMRLVSQVSYRTYDVTQRRAGAYFAHVLMQIAGDPPRGPQGRQGPPPPPPPPGPRGKIEPKSKPEWSARDAAQMWNWPGWVEEDSTDPNPPAFQKVTERFNTLPLSNGDPERVGDPALAAFLRGEPKPSWIPERWKQVPARVRQQLLVELLHGFLKLNVEARECFLIGIEPELAALLFFGVARLLPRRGPAEQLSFSTCEPQNIRPPFALAATHSYLGTPFALTDDPRLCTLGLSTFQSGWETTKTARNQGLSETSYAQAIVNLYVQSGPDAVDRFLKPADDESLNPQPLSANDLAELLVAEAYGQWVIGAAPPPVKLVPPGSKTGKQHVAAIVRGAMSTLNGDRLQQATHWRPLLQILAETEEMLGPGSGAEKDQRKKLVAEILTRVVHRAIDIDEYLKPGALPPEWQAQLLVQLIQGEKPLPPSMDDLWKGRFADARSGRQKWFALIADRLVTQEEGAAGLDKLISLYKTWWEVQPDLAVNAAVAQSQANVLQTLCSVAEKHPSVGAAGHLQRLVNAFLEKYPRWQDELLNRTHWSADQTKSLLEKYADRQYQADGQTVAETPLALRVFADLNVFPCPPPGEKSAPQSESWLEFLEAAEAALQLRRGKQISGWKHLRKLLGDLAAHWSAKPTGLQARFGSTEWETGAYNLGEKICPEVRKATRLELANEEETKSAWARLVHMQQLVNPSFKWNLRNPDDPFASRFCKEVHRTLRELDEWDERYLKLQSAKRSWIPAISINFDRKWVAIAAAVAVFIPATVIGVQFWPKPEPTTEVVKNKPPVGAGEGNSTRTNNSKATGGSKTTKKNNKTESPDPQVVKTDEPATPKMQPEPSIPASTGNSQPAPATVDPELTDDERKLIADITSPANPHLTQLTRRLIREHRQAFVDAFNEAYSPAGFISLPSVRWDKLSPKPFGPLGSPEEQLKRLPEEGAVNPFKDILDKEVGFSSLLLSNPGVSIAVIAAIDKLPNVDDASTAHLVAEALRQMVVDPQYAPLKAAFERRTDPVATTGLEMYFANTVIDACRKDISPDRLDRLKKVFDGTSGPPGSGPETMKIVQETAVSMIDTIAREVTDAERQRLSKLAAVRNNLVAQPPVQFVNVTDGSVPVDCGFEIEGIAIYGIPELNDMLNRRSPNTGTVVEPLWEDVGEGVMGVGIHDGPPRVMTIIPNSERPSSLAIAMSVSDTKKLPPHFLQSLVIEVSGRPKEGRKLGAPQVKWLALYDPSPMIFAIAANGDDTLNAIALPNVVLELLRSEAAGSQDVGPKWKAVVTKNGTRLPTTPVDSAALDSQSAVFAAWDIDRIYPSQYDPQTVTSSNPDLEEHPAIKQYQQQKQAHDAGGDNRPPAPKKPVPTVALSLMSRGTSRMVMLKDGHLKIILDGASEYHPFKVERIALQKEATSNGSGQLANLRKKLDQLPKDREEAAAEIHKLVKDSYKDIRFIPSLDRSEIESSKDAWLTNVRGKDASGPWIDRVKKEVDSRITAVRQEIAALNSTLKAFRESLTKNEKVEFTCEISGQRKISNMDRSASIRVPLTPTP